MLRWRQNERCPCHWYNVPANVYLNVTCPYTWGQTVRMSFYEVTANSYFTDNKILAATVKHLWDQFHIKDQLLTLCLRQWYSHIYQCSRLHHVLNVLKFTFTPHSSKLNISYFGLWEQESRRDEEREKKRWKKKKKYTEPKHAARWDGRNEACGERTGDEKEGEGERDGNWRALLNQCACHISIPWDPCFLI